MHATTAFEPHARAREWRLPVSLLGRLARIVDLAAAAIAIAWLAALLFQQLRLVAQVAPQEINEPGVWYATFLLDQGRNPYAVNELPGAAQFFPPLYNAVVLALKPLFGLGYPAHRMVNLLGLAGVLWLLVTRMRRLGAGPGIALLSAALFHWMCLQNIMVIARPDALGLLLALLAWLVPWERNYSRGSLLAGLGCALLAFHCKAYFGLAALPALVGAGLARSWREAAGWSAGFAVVLGESILALTRVFPLYYVETFVMQRNSVAENSVDPYIHAMHTAMLFERAWPYLLLLAVAAVGPVRRLRQETWRTRLRRWRDPADTPARRELALAVLLGVFGLHFALVYCYMGRNGGALFTYHLHLLFPALFLLAAAAVGRSPAARAAFGLVLAMFVCARLELRDVPDSSPGYLRLRQLIAANDPVLDSLSPTAELMATLGRPVHNNGFTLFLPFATMYDRPKWDPAARAIREAYDQQVRETTEHVKAEDFPLILTNDQECYFAPIELVREHYRIVERVDLPMYFGFGTIEAWKPRRTAGAMRTAP